MCFTWFFKTLLDTKGEGVWLKMLADIQSGEGGKKLQNLASADMWTVPWCLGQNNSSTICHITNFLVCFFIHHSSRKDTMGLCHSLGVQCTWMPLHQFHNLLDSGVYQGVWGVFWHPPPYSVDFLFVEGFFSFSLLLIMSSFQNI